MVIVSLILLVLLVLFLFASLIPLFVAMTRGAPYYPTNHNKQTLMLQFAALKPGEKAVDLGSGDGRLVIALAKAGAEAHGVEINPWLVWWSRWRIKKEGIPNAFIQWGSLWKINIHDYDAVLLYILPATMQKLEAKFKQQLKPGGRIVSNMFIFPTWKPTRTEDDVYLYTQTK